MKDKSLNHFQKFKTIHTAKKKSFSSIPSTYLNQPLMQNFSSPDTKLVAMVEPAGLFPPIPIHTSPVKIGLTDKPESPKSNLIENWSAYMTSMGSHYRAIAQESLFRSQYLSVNPTDSVYFYLI
jgi:hypothetical protein